MTQRYPDNSGRQRVAVFAGTFAPFTLGHDDIVRRGLELFDRVVILVGHNASKETDTDADARIRQIAALYAGDDRVSVERGVGLTCHQARELGACALLRGVRSVKDYEYERDMADVNQRVGGIETVLLVARPEMSWLSSSLVRELASYGQDVSGMLPPQGSSAPTERHIGACRQADAPAQNEPK